MAKSENEMTARMIETAAKAMWEKGMEDSATYWFGIAIGVESKDHKYQTDNNDEDNSQ